MEQKLKLMVVDDNPANLKLAGDLLEIDGYEVIRCIDAEHALEAIIQHRPALILMDIALPGMDGLELTRILKADVKTKAIKIITLTAFAMQGDNEKVLFAGCDGYITKPINTRQFTAQVKAYLNPQGENNATYTLLLVDDNPISLKLLKAVYETEGYEILSAGNGLEALEVLSEKHVDLIVTDVLMPDMDGYYLCYKIRSDEKLKDIPVIVYTATYTSLSEESVAKEMGADLFIRKPAPIHLLITSAKEILATKVKPVRQVVSAPKSAEAMHQYSSELINKLEKRSIELEKTKENLELTLNRFSQAQKIAHLGHGELDLITGRTIWSEEAYSILGLEPHSVEPSADSFLKFVHPEDIENVRAHFSESRQTFSPFSFNCRIIQVNGSLRHLFFRGGFEFAKTGEPIRLYGTTMDVTELVEKEEKLKEVNETLELTLKRFSQAQQIAHLGHWEVDLNTDTVMWSEEAFRILGLEPNSIEPSTDNFIKQIHPNDVENVRELIRHARETLTSYTVNARLLWPDGTIRHLFVKGEYEFDKRGKPLRVYGTMLDTTELVKKEEKLKEVNDELELFIYKSSHDIKGPIATLLGLVALAKRQTADKTILEFVNNIDIVTHKLKTTIAQLLKIMHLRKVQSDNSVIDMEELLKEIMDSFKYMEEYNNIKFNIVNEQTEPITANRELLFTILYNLMENSIRYKREGKSESEVNVKIMTNADRKKTLIEIADNGIGIPEKEKPKIFNMFYRASEKSEGAGLGLYLVKKAIEKVNGVIEFTSEQGIGSTFTITLPA